ncbi:eukaryotic elongation factor 5A hypusine, DNA-binding OB fold-domain-containing protein [Aspergillus novoparasiticus]|uniref:Eukaryotic translation initiation factor 5A n=1 Tax=Aspergillus novoparasiticus TaxID=986946 RepID=A0A5N6F9I1_9EURO|nr:eukaryotic elongation factor 5A hypusine, DNA-binding OB fold-domain-containing protein [Aspergillus novoparasiticus]
MKSADDEKYQQHVSQTYAARVLTLRKNGHVIIRGRPCKISEISKIGTHFHLVAEDIFTGRTLSDDIEPTQSVEVPNVYRNDYSLVNIDEGFLNLMTQDGTAKDDVKVPDGVLGDQIQQDFEAGKDLLITVLSAMGEEQAISAKEAAKGN